MFIATELQACAYLCSKDHFCGSFSYHGSTAECILSREGLTKMSFVQLSSIVDLAAYNKGESHILSEFDIT